MIQSSQVSVPIYTPVFKDEKNGVFKVVSFYAKKARGLMARYIIENRVRKIDDLRKFNFDNYNYQKELSTDTSLTFLRE